MAKTLQKTVEVRAPKENVWEVLTNPGHFADWSSEFHEGSHMEGEWVEGGTVYFKDTDGAGLIATVKELRPAEYVAVAYEGELEIGGVEDRASLDAARWQGLEESYELEEADGVTRLSVTTAFPDSLGDGFDPAWDRALGRIKELAEEQ